MYNKSRPSNRRRGEVAAITLPTEGLLQYDLFYYVDPGFIQAILTNTSIRVYSVQVSPIQLHGSLYDHSDDSCPRRQRQARNPRHAAALGLGPGWRRSPTHRRPPLLDQQEEAGRGVLHPGDVRSPLRDRRIHHAVAGDLRRLTGHPL